MKQHPIALEFYNLINQNRAFRGVHKKLDLEESIIDFENIGHFDLLSKLFSTKMDYWKIEKTPKEAKTHEDNSLMVLNWGEIKRLYTLKNKNTLPVGKVFSTKTLYILFNNYVYPGILKSTT